jgi:hypothetical protein
MVLRLRRALRPLGDTAALMRDRNFAENRGGQIPAPDETSEAGYRVPVENKSGKQCVEALINKSGVIAPFSWRTWWKVTAQKELLKGAMSFIDLDPGPA